MIIDCHCHAGPGDGFQGPSDSHAPLQAFLEWSSAADIQHTVLFPAFHSDYLIANRIVARIVRADRARFTGFAFIHAERDRGRVASVIGEMVETHGFRGIKVHRSDARISREIIDAARRFRVPVLYDPTGEVESVGLFAPQFPDVNFIIPHLGSFADDWRAQRAIADLLILHPNVYADTSGVRRFDLLANAVKRAGAGKFLFGSDGPWLHPGLELHKIRLLRLPPAQEALITGGNAARLLGIPQPAASRPQTASAPTAARLTPSRSPVAARRPAIATPAR